MSDPVTGNKSGFAARGGLVALVAALLQTSAFVQADTALPCRNNDRKCAAKALLQSPVRKISYWESAFARPVEQRLGMATKELVIYLNLDNIQNGYPDRPSAVTIPQDFLKDLGDAFAEMPPQVKLLVARKLAGIYLVKDLGGTGFTEYIFDDAASPVAGFVVLDMDVLAKYSANAWATWKENTPFKPDAHFKLEAEIEAQGQDNRKNAIQYILLHELGHIVSINETIHPRWDRAPRETPSLDGYRFARLSWEVPRRENRYASLFERSFQKRKDVVYYFGAKLAGDQVVKVYDQLEATNYPTLYAATKPADDFAESFVSYVHTVLLERPLQIRLYRDGRIAKTYSSCWEEKRCAEKRRLLEEFLKL